MIRQRWKNLAAPIKRRIPVCLALAGYLFAVFGPPLPASAPPCASQPKQETCCCCCAGQNQPCCCCCSADSNEKDPQDNDQEPAQPKKKSPSWGLGIFARTCCGDGPLWLTFEPAVAPPKIVQWNYEWSFTD